MVSSCTDGSRLAYRPYRGAHAGASGWRQHRGGSTPPVWVINLASNTLEKIPHVNASDTSPIWVNNDVVFISDRNDGAANPYAFKRMGLGPLIGKRTWGGLIGIAANPNLIDGGNLVVPFFRFFTPEREWRVENEGVAPDIDVELEPTEVNQGRDTQLDAALKSVMTQLESEKQITRKLAPVMPLQLGKDLKTLALAGCFGHFRAGRLADAGVYIFYIDNPSGH